VLQDDFGYIWIGCDAGLFKYDGFLFKQYTNPQQNGRGISFLQIDKKQRIWAKNFYGQIYRTENDSLKIIKHVNTSNPSYPQFTIDDDCNLWMYDSTQLSIINDEGVFIKSYSYDKIGIKTEVTSIKYFNQKIYLICSNLSVYEFNPGIEKSVCLKNTAEEKNITHSNILIQHQDKLLLLVEFENSAKKYQLFSLESNTIKPYYDFKNFDNSQRIYSIYSDNINVWATTSAGVFKINNTQAELFFKSEKVSYMLYDKEKQYWFSTLHNGLYIIPEHQVIKINSSNSKLNENNFNFIKKINSAKFLAGAYSGNLYEYDSDKQEINIAYEYKNEQFYNVKSILNTDDYIIVSRRRLCIIEKKTGKQYFPKLSNVRDIETIKDTIYLVFPDMIIKTTLVSLINNETKNYTTIKKSGGKSVEYNPQNNLLYFVLGEGVFTYDLKNSWTELTYNNEKIYASNIVYKNKTLWIASVSNGVFGIKNNKFEYHYTNNNYLKENNVRTLTVSDSNIWICTENYLHRINLISHDVSLFNSNHSINPKDINHIEVENNYIYLATNKGITFFPENMEWKNKSIPSIKLTGIYSNNENIDYTNTLKLPYTNNNIKISFNSTAFKSRGNFFYKYKLIGLDTGYTFIPASTPYIIFSRIPSGDYKLELKSINEHGVESKSIILPISVEIPFWQRWWFYVLIVFVFSGIVAIIFIARINFIRHKADLKNRMIASQLTALKSQMNPHFMFNTLNSLQDLILKNDIKSTNYYLSKYGLLMRKILEISEKNEILLSEEIEVLDTYLQLEKLRFGDDFKFKIETDENINTEEHFITPMIIQPFVENALKHGLMHKKGEKKLQIHFSFSKSLTCVIDDNGVGRKRSEAINKKQTHKHQSFATQATEKRIDLLNTQSKYVYHFEIIDKEENNLSVGTKVIIQIPNSIS